MNKTKAGGTTLVDNGLIWFGAALSVAEMLAGTYFRPLGLSRGIAAIVLGHVIGCALLFAVGAIGGRRRQSAMDSTKMSFGAKGGWLFAILNIIQLLGWTSIMIYDAALAAEGIWGVGNWLWCLIVGVLIAAWILVGVKNLGKLNIVAMTALFILTVILSVNLGKNIGSFSPAVSDAMTFGAALELSTSMPISWLPLIADYTSQAKRPVAAAGVSTIVYGIISCWMYLIGLGAALVSDQADIAQMMLYAGPGVLGLLIIVFSTVTTTFLDAWSAGVSTVAIWPKLSVKYIALAVTVIGTILAIAFNMDNISSFLYLIGSVFAPMAAIMITDHFILKRDYSNKRFDWVNLGIWLAGFIIYRLLMLVDLVIGYTIVDMAITMALCVAASEIRDLIGSNKTAKEKLAANSPM